MRVIHCINQFMPLTIGGTEIYVHALACHQQKGGHSVSIVTPHIDFYRPGQMNEHYFFEEIEVYQFLEMADPSDRKVQYGGKRPLGLNNFSSLLKSIRPDIIHFHELNRSIGYSVDHVVLAKKTGAKVYLTMHTSGYSCNTSNLIYNNEPNDGKIREFKCSVCSYNSKYKIPLWISISLASLSVILCKSKMIRLIPESKIKSILRLPFVISQIKNNLRLLSQNVDRIITLNNWYKEILVKNGTPENKIAVVPSALVSPDRAEISRATPQSGLPIRLVFVGRISPIKGIHLIIQALRHFSTDQVEIDIFGKSEDSEYYGQCIKDSRDISFIRWQGEISKGEVISRLSKYDLFCLASLSSEMSPLVIFEAFAAGIPVLASAVRGNMEKVKHGYNGLLFEFNSVSSLVKQIRTLVDQPHIINRLKKNITLPPDFEEVNQAYLDLYSLN